MNTAVNPMHEPVDWSERVSPSLGNWIIFWLPAPGAFLALLPINFWAALISGLAVWALSWWALALRATKIQMRNGYLTVGKARIELKMLGEATAIPKENLFLERGANLDARAYCSFQLGVRGLVKVMLLDENDPTPYWLFSSNAPDALAEKLNAAS